MWVNPVSWAYYFIDDVSVYEQKSVIFPDTVCKGESVQFTSNYSDPFSWYHNNILLSTDSIYQFIADKSATYILKTPNSIDTFSLFVKQDASFTLGNDTFLCSSDTIVKNIPLNHAIIKWNDGSTDSLYYIKKGGYYIVTASISGCHLTDTILIEEKAKPSLNFLSKSEFCSSDSTYIKIELDNQYAYYWQYSKDSGSIKNIERKGNYPITVIANNKCYMNETIQIQDICTPIIWIPNAFVPSGVNNLFIPTGINIKEYSMTIYSRWGEQLFVMNDAHVQWDGKYKDEICNEGIYLYLINYTGYNHKTYSLKGVVELIR